MSSMSGKISLILRSEGVVKRVSGGDEGICCMIIRLIQAGLVRRSRLSNKKNNHGNHAGKQQKILNCTLPFARKTHAFLLCFRHLNYSINPANCYDLKQKTG